MSDFEERPPATALRDTIAQCGTPQPNMSPINELRVGVPAPNGRIHDLEFKRPLGAEHAERLMPLTVDDGDMIMPMTEWQDRELELILDSGACQHVIDAEEAPGYLVSESVGSRRGQNFVTADGSRIPNEGQLELRMEAPIGDGVKMPVTTNFQVAAVTKPLLSVGKVCEQGHTVVFSKEGAKILDPKQRVLAHFQRSGGLYVSTMTLKAPEPFTRQAP